MHITPTVQIVSAVQVRSVGMIDGGDTVVIRVEVADGGEAFVIIPVRAAINLVSQVEAEITKPLQ